MCLMVMLCNIDKLKHLSENDLLTPVTPNDPTQFSRPITFVEGVKLMQMNKSRVNAMHSVGLGAFLVKMTF